MRTRAVWIIAVLFCVALAIYEGFMLFGIYSKGLQEQTQGRNYSKYYVMITEEPGSSLWRAICQGAVEAGEEQDAYVELWGEKVLSQYSVSNLMEIAIASKVDGMIVSADESERIHELIEEAQRAGIPVVTLYNDLSQSSRISFVGVGSYNLGCVYGKKVVDMISENADLASGDVTVTVLVSPDVQESGQNIMFSGIQETLEKETGISLSMVNVDNTSTFSAEESIRELVFQTAPDIVICMNETNTSCAYQAVVDYNKVGRVHILGYYDSDAILKAIDRGVIDATVSVDARQMGRFCMEAFGEYYEYGKASQYYTADITLIDKGNVSAYLEEKTDEN